MTPHPSDAHSLSEAHRVVVLGLVPFNGLPQRELALAAGLASRGFAVDYIEGMPSLAAITRDGLRRLTAPLRVERRHDADAPPAGLRVHVPPVVPTFFRSSWTPALDRRMFRRWFGDVFRDVDWARTILLVTMPYWWRRFLDRADCPARIVVYDRYDALEVSARNARARDRFLESERLLAREADIITCSAHALTAELTETFRAGDILLLPNAVDAAWTATPPPGADGRNRGDIAFLGSTEAAWFDLPLLLGAVAAMPECRFHVIGPVGAAMRRRVEGVPNIVLHGTLAPDAAAAILRRAAAGIIPFRRNAITDAVNPLKMYEYAACGLPVVAIRTAELARYADVVTTTGDASEFVGRLRRAVATLDDAVIARQHAFASANTWDHRVDALLAFIGDRIGSAA